MPKRRIIEDWRTRYIPEFEGKKGNFLEIEPDLGEVFTAIAKVLVQRKTSTLFKGETDAKLLHDIRIGVIGSLMFQSMLNQCYIPYIVDPEVFYMKEHRTFYDFIIPNFATVEIKARPKNTDCVIIRQDEWRAMICNNQVPGYVIALRLHSDTVSEIMGWIHGKDVKDLPNNPQICRYTPCHWKPYKELNDFEDLIPQLRKASLLPRKFDVAFRKYQATLA